MYIYIYMNTSPNYPPTAALHLCVVVFVCVHTTITTNRAGKYCIGGVFLGFICNSGKIDSP